MGRTLKSVGSGFGGALSSMIRRTLAAPFRAAEGATTLAVSLPDFAANKVVRPLVNTPSAVWNASRWLSNKLFNTNIKPAKYVGEFNAFKPELYSDGKGATWLGTSEVKGPIPWWRKLGRLGGNIALSIPNAFRQAGDIVAGKSAPRLMTDGWRAVGKDTLKNWASAGLTGITAGTAANYIAPENGLYWKYRHNEGETYLKADPASLIPRIRMESDVRTDKDGKPVLDYSAGYRLPEGELVKANPWATALANTLRVFPTFGKAMITPNLASTYIPRYLSPEDGKRRFGYESDNKEFAELNKLTQLPEEASRHNSPVATYITRSAELARIYADNIKRRMSDLYATKSPSELRDMISGDKAALADYLLQGVEEPKYEGVSEALTDYVYEKSREGIRNKLIKKLNENLNNPNIGRGAFAVRAAGNLPLIGSQVDEAVHDAIHVLMSDLDRDLNKSYIKEFKKDDNFKMNFISNLLGWNASDILDAADTGIRDGNRRLNLRLIDELNERQN